MRKSLSVFISVITFVLLAATGITAQTISQFAYTITNDVQVSATTLEFDLFIRDADATEPFELNMIQAGIRINPAIINGGSLSVSRVEGSSQLVVAQQPGTANILWAAAQNTIKITPKLPTDPGMGTILSTEGNGTRIVRLRITNTVPFTSYSTADLSFSFTTVPYPTKVFQTLGLSTQLTCNSSNTYSTATNVALNVPPTAFEVVGGGSYCEGLAGIAVNLSGSETGVLYTLLRDGSPVGESVIGTGSVLNFGNQTAGTYTISAERMGFTTVMTGNAVITMNPEVLVSIAIEASINNVCSGTEVSFTATSVNGGSNPVITWFVDGIAQTETGTVFTYIPQDNDNVTCQMSADVNCPSVSTAISNSVVMDINPVLTPAVNIVSNAVTVCEGTAVDFTAQVTHGGNDAQFVWSVNGINQPTSGAEFSYVPVNGDIIGCELTSSETCVTSATATSNFITISTTQPVVASITIEASENNVCEGTVINFTAYSVNGGLNPSYNWKINGNIVSEDGSSFAFQPQHGDVVTCELISSESCIVTSVVESNAVTLNIIDKPSTPTITFAGIELISSASEGNQWYYATDAGQEGTLIEGAVNNAFDPSETGYYYTIVTINGCVSDSSEHYFIDFTGVNTIAKTNTSLQLYPVPNNGIFNLKLDNAQNGTYYSRVYNKMGMVIYESQFEVTDSKIEKLLNIRPIISGTYTLTITGDDYTASRKFVVN